MVQRTYSKGIQLKKKFGQHFLRDESVVLEMMNHVALKKASVFEIGPGDGFLTRYILQKPIERLWVFEIDPEWAELLRDSIKDERLTIIQKNILDVDFSVLESHKPWILLANLPYQVTFPILYRLQEHRSLLQEGVIMIQEEVAQKLVKMSGRGYGFPALFFNHYFTISLLSKVPPTVFKPPPKVMSRLVYLKPKKEIEAIQDEAGFWRFIKVCFKQPRRTLANNLRQTHIDLELIPEEYKKLRAQQMTKDDLLALWNIIRPKGN